LVAASCQLLVLLDLNPTIQVGAHRPDHATVACKMVASFPLITLLVEVALG
jgi:hypothetical protein